MSIADVIDAIASIQPGAKKPRSNAGYADAKMRPMPMNQDIVEDNEIINIQDEQVERIETMLRDMVKKMAPDVFNWSSPKPWAKRGWLSRQFERLGNTIEKISDDLQKNKRESLSDLGWNIYSLKSKFDDASKKIKPRLAVVLTNEDFPNAGIYTESKPVVMAVSRGLLKNIKSMDELAAILMHEVAHKVIRQTHMNRHMPGSKGEEFLADIEGLERAAKAGFNPKAILEFWKENARRGHARSFVESVYEAHPEHENRLAILETKLADHSLFGQKFTLNLDHTTDVPQDIVNFTARKDKLHISHADRHLAADYEDRDTVGKLRALTDWVKTWSDTPTEKRQDILKGLVNGVSVSNFDATCHEALAALMDALHSKQPKDIELQANILANFGIGLSYAKNPEPQTMPDGQFQMRFPLPSGPLYAMGEASVDLMQACQNFLESGEDSGIEAKARAYLVEFNRRPRFFKNDADFLPYYYEHMQDAMYEYGRLPAQDQQERLQKISNLAYKFKDNPVVLEALWVSHAHKPEYWWLVPISMLEMYKKHSGITKKERDMLKHIRGEEKTREAVINATIQLRQIRKRFDELQKTVDLEGNYDGWLTRALPDIKAELSYNHPKELAKGYPNSQAITDYFDRHLANPNPDPLVLKRLSSFLKDIFLPAMDLRKAEHLKSESNTSYLFYASDKRKQVALADDHPLLRLIATEGRHVLNRDEMLQGMTFFMVNADRLMYVEPYLPAPATLKEFLENQEKSGLDAKMPLGYSYAREIFRRLSSQTDMRVFSEDFWALTIAGKKKDDDHLVFFTSRSDYEDAYKAGHDVDAISATLFKAPYDDSKYFADHLGEQFKGKSSYQIISAYMYLADHNHFPTNQHRADMGQAVLKHITSNEDSFRQSYLAWGMLTRDKAHPLGDLIFRDQLVDLYVRKIVEQHDKESFLTKHSYLETQTNDIFRSTSERDRPVILDKLADALEIQPKQAVYFDRQRKAGLTEVLAVHVGIASLEDIMKQIVTDPTQQRLMLDFLADGKREDRDALVPFMMTQYARMRENRFGVKIAFREEQAALQLDDIRLHYRSMGIEGRAAILAVLLIPGAHRVDQAKYDEEMAKAFEYVLGRLIPPNSPNGDQIRSFMKSYLGASENFERVPLLAGLMAAQEDRGHDVGNFSIGKMMANILPRLGPAYVKLGQSIHSHPACPPDLREDLSILKGHAVHEPRWLLLERIKDTLSPQVFNSISHFGQVLGSASFNTAIEVKVGFQKRVLLLEHPYAMARANKGFNTMTKTVTDWDDPLMNAHKDVVLDMVKEGQKLSVLETDHASGDIQYQHAQSAYKDFSIHIKDGVRSVKIDLDPVPCYESGEGWRIIGLAEGQHFEDMPDGDPDKRLLAKGYLAFELHRIASGQVFDCDRHGQQLKYTKDKKGNYTFGLYDFGGMSMEPATQDETKALVRVAMNLAQAIQTGDGNGDLGALMTQAVNDADASVKPYLSRVRKSWLALQDFAKHLEPKDYLDVADSILAAPMAKSALQEMVTAGMQLTGQLPPGQAADVNAMMAVNASQIMGMIGDSLKRGNDAPITFKRQGRKVQPGFGAKLVQNQIRKEVRSRTAQMNL